jgi:hypothetical protein
VSAQFPTGKPKLFNTHLHLCLFSPTTDWQWSRLFFIKICDGPDTNSNLKIVQTLSQPIYGLDFMMTANANTPNTNISQANIPKTTFAIPNTQNDISSTIWLCVFDEQRRILRKFFPNFGDFYKNAQTYTTY